MKSIQMRFAVVALTLLAAKSHAGKYNATLSIGSIAPAWTELPGVDGKKHSLTDLGDKKAVVVVFTCNSCPYAVDVERRLNTLSKEIADGRMPVGLVAINVNNVEADKMPAMKKKADLAKFAFPYLYDETQKIARDYGATRTPEFFVLDESHRIVYMGALDDDSSGRKVTKRYVRDAVDATLAASKPGIAETPPVGCAIRFDKPKRKPKSD